MYFKDKEKLIRETKNTKNIILDGNRRNTTNKKIRGYYLQFI